MYFPRNGKVVVFDDKPDEVKDLFKALSANRVPYLYYQDEGGKDLPSTFIDGVRIVILDLQLFTNGLVSEKNIIASIGTRLDRILEKENCYILLYWSGTEDKYRKILEDAFNNELKAFKPLFQLSLNKSAALLAESPFNYIKDKLTEELKNIDPLKAFLFWENIAGVSASKLVTYYTNLISRDDNWNNDLKFVLEKLAQAYTGKRSRDNGYALNKKLNDAFCTLNHTLIDSLEHDIKIQCQSFNANGLFSNRAAGKTRFSHKINSKLLTSEPNDDGLEPGSVFFVDDDISNYIKKLNADYTGWLASDKIPPEIKEKHGDARKKRLAELLNLEESKQKRLSRKYNRLLHFYLKEESRAKAEEILKNSIKCELNISPLCDYAQGKIPIYRILPGIMINEIFRDDLPTLSDSLFISEVPVNFNEESYYFIFDFKYLYASEEGDLLAREPKLKIRHQLLADIQRKLANHVNRAGVIFVSNE